MKSRGVKLIATALHTNASLVRLNLRRNSITANGVEELCLALTDRYEKLGTSIDTLNLSWNMVGTAAATVLAVPCIEWYVSYLRYLTAMVNGMSHEYVIAFAQPGLKHE